MPLSQTQVGREYHEVLQTLLCQAQHSQVAMLPLQLSQWSLKYGHNTAEPGISKML